jgi:CHAT domain-containing protein
LIVSRWGTPPTARDRLMAALHARLRDGEPTAAALAAAQRAVRSQPESAAPIHWAGWMLIGSGR